MTDRYDDLRAAASRATPGPWQRNGTRMKWRSAGRPQELDSHTVGPDGDALAIVPFDTKSGLGLADAAFIALANPKTIKALLDERDSLLAAKEADGRQKRAYLDEIDRLKDTVEGLTCDLRLAVETAYHRGATDWTRLNYPRIYAALTTKEG